MSVTFINKYEDTAGGQTAEQKYAADATAREALGKSTVSLAGKLHYDGVNVEVPRKAVKVGTLVYADSSGNLHFIDGATAKGSAISSGWELAGVVALRRGNKATVLYKSENTSVQFTSCWAWEITGLTYGASNSIVFQQVAKTEPYGKVTVGTCTFTPTDIDDAVSKIDEWLRQHPGDTDVCYRYDWHCAKLDGRILVISDFNSGTNYRQYTTIHGTGTTSGVVTKTNMWELAGYVDTGNNVTRRPDGVTAQSNYLQRNDGKSDGSRLWNKDVAKSYMAENGNIGTPIDDSPDDSSGIYAESNFTSANCPNTYGKYAGDYDAYLESKMCKYPSNVYAMKVFAGDARSACETMSAVEYVPLAGGNAVKMFKAVNYSKTCRAHSTASVDGLNAGDWYMPGMDEIVAIFSQLKVDGSDAIHTALANAGLASAFPVKNSSWNIYRWVPARGTSYTSWLLNPYGYIGSGYLYSSSRAVAVALLNL